MKRTESVTGLPIGEEARSPYIGLYLACRKEYDERNGSAEARAHGWKLVAIAAIALSCLLGIGLTTVASESHVEPFVVEVNKLGQAIAVSAADKAHIPDARIVRYQLASYITDARSVTPDGIVEKRWLNSVYAMSSGATKQYLTTYYKTHDPFNIARKRIVDVDIQSTLPLSKKSWQIEWSETARGLDGSVIGITHWQAVLNIAIVTPKTAAAVMANPTGVVVEQLSWTQQL